MRLEQVPCGQWPGKGVSGLTADTGYSFTVQAKDAAGNKSVASRAVTARTRPGGPGGGRTFANGADYPIRNFQTAVSPTRKGERGIGGSGREGV
ncbi:hypothetical protein EV644_101732 [Kribbella orskensis]|uniref:Fibronectin type-III domain-containing protein n=1 Tax=Kribbella orskensis TaxID=2512216 RepID=A0ABY2BVQ1_9ACTN|nr:MULTISPECIES: hypothetical protein [Kribbella]TCN44133.1 hypothetical protein EV642_101257 [Kribbella sp. VKM Ac-2500]TCO32089.1 hypothetical protein EV644_101732 [Kribbella orskensis]